MLCYPLVLPFFKQRISLFQRCFFDLGSCSQTYIFNLGIGCLYNFFESFYKLSFSTHSLTPSLKTERLALSTISSLLVDQFGLTLWLCYLEFDKDVISDCQRSESLLVLVGNLEFLSILESFQLSFCDSVILVFNIKRTML